MAGDHKHEWRDIGSRKIRVCEDGHHVTQLYNIATEGWHEYVAGGPLDDLQATIARLERERDEARGVRDHYIQQYERAVDLLKEADASPGQTEVNAVSETPSITEGESIRRLPGGLNVCTYCFARGWPKPHHFDFCIWKNGTEVSTVAGDANETLKKMLYRTVGERDDARETIARLERERDAARQDAQEFDKARRFWQAEASRTGADAARMRLFLSDHKLLFQDALEIAGRPDEVERLRAALAPDDGWLARKIEEAVEPYREALQEVNDQVEMRRELGRGDTRKVQAIVDRALLGGTPVQVLE